MSSQWRLDGAHAREGPASSGHDPQLACLRVLVVDANRDAADSLVLLLRLWGCSVRAAYSAAEALKVNEAFPPDIIISEIVLPQQNGFELARQLRQGRQQILLVALTSQGQAADRLRCREAGFDVHLVKPAAVRDLQNILRLQTAAVGLIKEDQATMSSTDQANLFQLLPR